MSSANLIRLQEPEAVLRRSQPASSARQQGTMERFLSAQVTNTRQHIAALRPFRPDEFGTAAGAPSLAHIQASNRLIMNLRQYLMRHYQRLLQAQRNAQSRPASANLNALLASKDRVALWVKFLEKTWDFYFMLFGQRQADVGRWLLACDRLALDCYQAAYTGLGKSRSIPTPPPFTFMATGFSPATFRRGIRLSKIGKLANPFPVVELPYHRLVNPWTLGAVPHEVSHNLQNDLGLWEVVPRLVRERLQAIGIAEDAAATWSTWHKEIWADLAGLLLGGPHIVDSLIDVLGRTRRPTLSFNSSGVHPTPYLRLLISLELLSRMGFSKQAGDFRRFWKKLYPAPERSNLPAAMLRSFKPACEAVVDTLCYQPYPQLGGKSLAQVTSFKPVHLPMVEEAARRLAEGNDPGILPERFLIGAARQALDQGLAPPEKITRNFYRALVDR